MTYRPQEFWERRLSDQFDLRGTGESGLSLAYNRACYRVRQAVLARALSEAGFEPAGRRVLDVGCGTGFFTGYYVERGARVTGIDIAPVSIDRLRARFPMARFRLADVSEKPLEDRFDLVHAFDVLYHITDDRRWEAALHHLAAALEPQGLLLVTDMFSERGGQAEHNRTRPLARYHQVLEEAGVQPGRIYPTHVLLNRELGPFRFLNRLPELLRVADGLLLRLGIGNQPAANKVLVARRLG